MNDFQDDSLGSIEQDVQDQDYGHALSQSQSAAGSSESLEQGSKLFEIYMPGTQGGKKITNRVCCCRIKNEYTMKIQLTCSLIVLSVSVFLLVSGIVIGNILLTKYLVKKSSSDALKDQLNNNLERGQIIQKLNAENYFQSISNMLVIIESIILNDQKKDNRFGYDKDFIYPLKGQKQYSKVNQQIPSNIHLANLDSNWSQQLQKVYGNITNQLSFKTFQYQSTQQSNLSNEGQSILDSVDIISYFFQDFYYDYDQYHIYELFIYFPTDNITVYFPGGLQKNQQNYNPQQTLWYKQTMEYHNENKSKLKFPYQYIISGPFIDETSNEKLVTLSQLILQPNNDVFGIIGVNIKSRDLQSVIDQTQLIKSQYNIFINEDGVVLTDPFSTNKLELIYESLDYKISESLWNDLKKGKKQDMLEKQNTDNQQILTSLLEIGNNKNKKIYLMTYILDSEAFGILEDIKTKIWDLFEQFQYYTVAFVFGVFLLFMVSSYFFISRALTPFIKLTEKAKYLGGNIETLRKHQERDNKQMQDLDNLKAEGTIGELILRYQTLRKGLQGNKKKAAKNEENNDLQVEYPDNNIHGDMKWSQEIHRLENIGLDSKKEWEIKEINCTFKKYNLLLDEKNEKFLKSIEDMDKKQDKSMYNKRLDEYISRGQKELLDKFLPQLKVEYFLS